jgi:hypothetical protein
MNAIVADGRGRWYAAWNSELERRALEWFAVELNRGSWWRRRIVLFRLRRKLAAIVRRKKPSARTLW